MATSILGYQLPLRSTWVEDCQVVYSLHGFLSPAPIPRRVEQANATTTTESFQAPNSIDRSNSWRLWLTGTTTRKPQLSPATRKRVRMDRSNPPHCPACGDMPAGASRARTDPTRPFLNHRSYPNRCSGENRCIDTFGGALRPYVRTDAGGNPGRRFVHRVSRQMGVAGRRLDLAVTKQLADRRQALAQRQGT